MTAENAHVAIIAIGFLLFAIFSILFFGGWSEARRKKAKKEAEAAYRRAMDKCMRGTAKPAREGQP